jgi:hypothetical protein
MRHTESMVSRIASNWQCAATLTVLLLATSVHACRVVRQVIIQPPSGPPTLNLGSAADFTVLAYSTVTNTGPTFVGGLLGVSPLTAVTGSASITYLANPTVKGQANPDTAALAKLDANAAYIALGLYVDNVVVLGGGALSIGGMTFTPGLYKTTGSMEVPIGGEVTFSGLGVYIMQMETTLLMQTSTKMILANGARACDIFWRVGSSATFNVDSVVVGTVIALTAISALTRATVEGRLFALNAAVTMDSNTIVYPCANLMDWASGSTQATINLGAAADFSVLAYAEVTNTGATSVTGLVGVSPGTSIVPGSSGFSFLGSGAIGSVSAAAAAKFAITDAYLQASSRTTGEERFKVLNIAGITFGPGLYKSSAALEVNGILTLDGPGVYIFNVESTFIVSTGSKIVLTGGARACDVFWRMGSAATFKVGSEVAGTFMAYSAITVQTNVKVDGRLFALNEAVTMDTNVVSGPAC